MTVKPALYRSFTGEILFAESECSENPAGTQVVTLPHLNSRNRI